MGKGKGTFEYWACRAPVGKVIFEIGGGGIAEQVAKDGEQCSTDARTSESDGLFSTATCIGKTASNDGVRHSCFITESRSNASQSAFDAPEPRCQ